MIDNYIFYLYIYFIDLDLLTHVVLNKLYNIIYESNDDNSSSNNIKST